jgi:hypothetical protein
MAATIDLGSRLRRLALEVSAGVVRSISLRIDRHPDNRPSEGDFSLYRGHRLPPRRCAA